MRMNVLGNSMGTKQKDRLPALGLLSAGNQACGSRTHSLRSLKQIQRNPALFLESWPQGGGLSPMQSNTGHLSRFCLSSPL
ncbi:hypothetical protein EV682_10340 [Iodobacter fluviatilis]|uniref:Uncharacterized protein n=1 Tax=Iodobacter fluviatilis TaxID=537 RepID=A0A377Q9A3_9NEIS|nr:hypothetical protein EV682_10340 [Iodobacter fluviatilis]STQ91472.1 Uncharacterised protein [Iodobacter fluviatilis]